MQNIDALLHYLHGYLFHIKKSPIWDVCLVAWCVFESILYWLPIRRMMTSREKIEWSDFLFFLHLICVSRVRPLLTFTGPLKRFYCVERLGGGRWCRVTAKVRCPPRPLFSPSWDLFVYVCVCVRVCVCVWVDSVLALGKSLWWKKG